MASKKNFFVPTFENGSIPHYFYHSGPEDVRQVRDYEKLSDGSRDWNKPIYEVVKMKEPTLIKAILRFVELHSNIRSGAYAIMENVVTHATYPISLKELDRLIPHMVKGTWEGIFEINKRGQNFTISPILDM